MSLLALVIVPLIVALFAAQIDRDGRSIGEALVRLAAFLVPPHERDDQRDEWIDHVREAGERGIRPVCAGMSIALTAAPVIAILARYDAHRTKKTVARKDAAAPDHRENVTNVFIDASVLAHTRFVRTENGVRVVPANWPHELSAGDNGASPEDRGPEPR